MPKGYAEILWIFKLTLGACHQADDVGWCQVAAVLRDEPEHKSRVRRTQHARARLRGEHKHFDSFGLCTEEAGPSQQGV